MTEAQNRTFERKKRKLESYIELKYKAESKHNDLISLVTRISEFTGVQGIEYNDMPKGKPILFTDIIDDLLTKEKILRNSLFREERRKEEIENAIDDLEDNELRIILRMKYIDGYSFSKIGEFLRCHKMTAWNKCQDAIFLIDF